ncbi:MAG: adenosylhomocysteinase [Kiritimatiellia bacterium]|jgi:adenosylhomocysteinase
MSMPADRAYIAASEIGRINAFFPILPHLGNRWAASRPWEGRTIALNLHLTTLTAGLVRELTLGGGKWVIAAASEGTTHPNAVELLRTQGIDVYTGADGRDRYAQAMSHSPDLLVDVSFDLIERAVQTGAGAIHGSVIVSRSAVSRLHKHGPLPFPVVDITSGRLKDAVESRHGVGEAIWLALQSLTGMHLSGRRVAVVGYGPVGKGLAAYARAAGMNVEVVERDPVTRLLAHYDGFPTPNLTDAISRVGVLVTATGTAQSVTVEHMAAARDGLVLLNAGRGGDELDIKGLRDASAKVEHISEQVIRYRIHGGPRLTILGNGHPLNIVINSGSPEPVLLQFALLGLALDWTANTDLEPGLVPVTAALEEQVASVALNALDQAGG